MLEKRDMNFTLDFDNTTVAYAGRTLPELRRAYWLFSMLAHPVVASIAPRLLLFCRRIGLPVDGIIRRTVFAQFCGGESIEECAAVVSRLARVDVGATLDFAAEGATTEESFAANCLEILRTMEFAVKNPSVRFCVFKVSAIADTQLLARMATGTPLSADERSAVGRLDERVHRLCRFASEQNVRVFVDAEESWLHGAIDEVVINAMRTYNKKRAVVYGTLQLYRRGQNELLAQWLEKAEREGFFLGLKLVRGAYMEKERAHAAKLGKTSPIWDTKEQTDSEYNKALRTTIQNIERAPICVATHNEDSCRLAVSLMAGRGLAANDPRVEFSQLYGMRDYLTRNLVDAGFFASKYLPYGPLPTLLPYLIRRAQENSSLFGHVQREMAMLAEEIGRRRRELMPS